MPHRVNPAMNAMQPATVDTNGDRVAPQARRAQLRDRHNTVLATRDHGDLDIGFGAFVPHVGD